MIFEATGSTTYGELSVDSLKLREDNQILTDLFNILSNQVGEDIPFEGSTYRPVNQLRDAISRIKSGTYSMVSDRPVSVTTTPHPAFCPKCYGQSNGTICQQCRSGEVETRMAQGSKPLLYSHVCKVCGCSINNSAHGENHACPSCDSMMVTQPMPGL